MPSLRHEVLVDLLRCAPRIAPLLLSRCLGPPGLDDPRLRVEVASADLATVAPVSHMADLLLRLHDAQAQVVASVIVEVQLRRDGRKPASWACYVAGEFLRTRAPVYLLVLAGSAAVARWARRKISPSSCLTVEPIVIAPEDMPRIVDPGEARASPELAILSALAHARDSDGGEVAWAARQALPGVAEDRAKLYDDFLWLALGDAARAYLEARMDPKTYKVRSEFLLRHMAVERQEGRQEGLLRAVLAIAGRRLGMVPPDLAAALAAMPAEALEGLVGDLAVAEDPKATLARICPQG